MFKKEQDALAKRKQNLQNKNDADWAKKMASSGKYGFNTSSNDTASVPATPSANQGKIDADKQAFMQNKPKSVAKNTEWNAGKDFSGIDSGVKNTTFNPNKQGTQVNPNKSVASGTGENKPMLYKNPSWRNNLGLNQDDEMVDTVDDTASAPLTPQRKLPASVYDGEGPESVTSSGRDAREMAAIQKRRKYYQDNELPDPYATRKLPAAMTQAQIDARNASNSKFARNPDGSRKQQSIAQALVNPSSNNDELISQTDDSAGAAVSPSSGPTTYTSDAPDNFLQSNPQPADDSTVTSSPIINVDDAPEDKKPEDKTADETNPFLTRLQNYHRDKEEKRREKEKEKKKDKTKEKEPIPQTSFYPDSEMGDGDYDIDSASMLTRNDKIASSSVRPKPGTGAKAFAKQLGYSSFADFLKANKKNVNKAANGNWVVHPNKDYIPAK